jgi:hypothetical protein
MKRSRVDFRPNHRLDIVNNIIAYENGDLDETDVVTLFQQLVDTGLAWQLQSAYGRQTMRFLQDGLITKG